MTNVEDLSNLMCASAARPQPVIPEITIDNSTPTVVPTSPQPSVIPVLTGYSTPAVPELSGSPTSTIERTITMPRGTDARTQRIVNVLRYAPVTRPTAAQREATPDTYEHIERPGNSLKWGLDSITCYKLFTYDPTAEGELDYESFVFRTWGRRYNGMPVALRQFDNNNGNLRWSARIKVQTEAGHGQNDLVNQIVRRAAPIIQPELVFNVSFTPAQLYRHGTYNDISELNATTDGLDLRAAQSLVQARLGVDIEVATLLMPIMQIGLDWYDTTTWYTMGWLLFYHIYWMEEQAVIPQYPQVENDVVELLSWRPVPADADNNWCRLYNLIANNSLVIFTDSFHVDDLRIFWMIANGLPRLATPVMPANQRVCLLDEFHIPAIPIGMCFPNAPAIPNMGAITAAQVKNALARMAAHRHDCRFVVAGKIRAAMYFNRWTPRLAAGAGQAFLATYEWRASEWPRPYFSNSLLIFLQKFISPVEDWTVDEAADLFGLSDLHLSDMSVWISASVALSMSTSWNHFSISGDDLSRYGRVFAPSPRQECLTINCRRIFIFNSQLSVTMTVVPVPPQPFLWYRNLLQSS
ncbi:hypothetical protein GJ496_001590 [Pomphorhynchus laevis]|nr:hypothetical protein GJ496_001590 [Pomphorhynchus laevis]